MNSKTGKSLLIRDPYPLLNKSGNFLKALVAQRIAPRHFRLWFFNRMS